MSVLDIHPQTAVMTMAFIFILAVFAFLHYRRVKELNSKISSFDGFVSPGLSMEQAARRYDIGHSDGLKNNNALKTIGVVSTAVKDSEEVYARMKTGELFDGEKVDKVIVNFTQMFDHVSQGQSKTFLPGLYLLVDDERMRTLHELRHSSLLFSGKNDSIQKPATPEVVHRKVQHFLIVSYEVGFDKLCIETNDFDLPFEFASVLDWYQREKTVKYRVKYENNLTGDNWITVLDRSKIFNVSYRREEVR
jgi:hypothetical protein